MLKIEQDRSLVWRKKEHFFNSYLFWAFLLATTLHGLGWILFKIQEPPSPSNFLFPKAIVYVPLIQETDLAMNEEEDLPPLQLPQIPLLPLAQQNQLLSPFLPEDLPSNLPALPLAPEPLLTYSLSASIEMVGETGNQVSLLNEALVCEMLLEKQEQEMSIRFDFLFDPLHSVLIAPVQTPPSEAVAALLIDKLKLKSHADHTPHTLSLEVHFLKKGQLCSLSNPT